MAWIGGERGSLRVFWRELRVNRQPGQSKYKTCASEVRKDKIDAAAELRRVEAQQEFEKRLRKGGASNTPLPVLVERWRISRIEKKRATETFMLEATEYVLKAATVMKWGSIADITPDQLDLYRAKHGGTDKRLVCIRAFLRFCQRTFRVMLDPFLFIDDKPGKKKKRKPDLLTDQQIAIAQAAAFTIGGPSVGAIVEHLALYPCRPIDPCRMTVGDWDSARRIATYRDTKNKNDQSHLVHEAHALRLDELTKGRKPEEPLFLDRWGRPWKINKHGKASGLTSWYYANIGRHYFTGEQRGIYRLKDYAMTRASRAADGNMRTVVKLSGHESIEAAELYIGTNNEAVAKLLEKMPMIENAAALPESKLRRDRKPKDVCTNVSTPAIQRGSQQTKKSQPIENTDGSNPSQT